MRIDSITAAYHSIVWVACDTAGHIVIANSNEGTIPSFAAEDRERTEILANRLCGLTAIDRDRNPPIDYKALANKGFYCFANTDPYDGTLYTLCAKPQEPITVADMESDLCQMLHAQRLPLALENCDRFHIHE